MVWCFSTILTSLAVISSLSPWGRELSNVANDEGKTIFGDSQAQADPGVPPLLNSLAQL